MTAAAAILCPLAAAGRTLTVADVAGLVIAALLAMLGVRSLVKWLRQPFEASSAGERLLYAVNGTTRVGIWFAFAGILAGYALVPDPRALRPLVLIPLVLAAIQVITALVLKNRDATPGAG